MMGGAAVEVPAPVIEQGQVHATHCCSLLVHAVFGDNVTNDCNGHGTHVAATVGGLTYGVAKNVTLWAVRAMDCSGDAEVSDLIAAFEWIADNHQSPAVVSMSVAGDLSPTVNEAARRLVEDFDIAVVVAAGNAYSDACQMSPASAPAVVSVGASDEYDRRWAESNFGPCVDIHAPGVDVVSAVNTSDTATMVKTGTSMATPHVAGVVALYLETHPVSTVGGASTLLALLWQACPAGKSQPPLVSMSRWVPWGPGVCRVPLLRRSGKRSTWQLTWVFCVTTQKATARGTQSRCPRH